MTRRIVGQQCFFQRVIKGDNQRVLKTLSNEFRERITLVYFDPPFGTQKKYTMDDGRDAFDDRWSSKEHYLGFLHDRIELIWPLLAPHGSLLIHVDQRSSHHIRLMCDLLLGEEKFASHIIWRYRRWPSKTPNFQRVHDILLRYRKDITIEPRFVPAFEPLAQSTIAQWGTTKQCALFDELGNRTRSSKTNTPSPGVPLGDVWDISIVAPSSKERTGFPTQKPEALLRRIVGCLSHEKDIVLDPFCGSGTTLVVAASMGRHVIGIDESKIAIEITKERLAKLEPDAEKALLTQTPTPEKGEAE